jgi:lipopolysaccharide/colanic/teichoic acid biosynthesis glycosyltransferase
MINIIDRIVILIFSPILLLLILLITVFKIIFDGLPVFYSSTRFSSINKPFVSIKFRSMINNITFIESEIKKYNKGGFESIPLSSSVYTRFGRFLERTQLVELPQLFNCFRGDLSLVGCRPLPKKNLKELEKKFGHKLIEIRGLRKGGLAGTAQLFDKGKLTSSQRLEIEITEVLFFLHAPIYKQLFIYFSVLIGVLIFIIFNKVPLKFKSFIMKNLEKYKILT